MSYANYDSRHYQRPRHDSHYSYSTSRDTDAYARHEQPSSAPHPRLTTMPYSVNSSRPYTSSYNSYDSYEPRAPPLPRRSAAPSHYRTHARKPTWPPSPSVEDERAEDGEGEPPVNTRGTVDQEALLDEIEQPDRRFVLVSEPSTDDDSKSRHSTVRDRRRKSFAERGNMAHIKTDVHNPPVFTERVSTPYAYTKPQRESTAPDFLRSPDPITPSNTSIPRSAPNRDTRDAQRDQNAKPHRRRPSHSRDNSYDNKSRHTLKDDLFDDSDLESEDTTRLRTERKPARYSFVKSDLHKEDLKTNLRDTQPRPESRRRDSGRRSPPEFRKGDSSGSSRDTSYAQSPRSSASSLNNGNRKSRPAPVETGYPTSPRPSSRPSSPLQRAPSPKLPTRLRESPPSTRPSSRGNTRPSSPLAFSSTVRPPSPGRVHVTEADWHSTYPPVTTSDRSRPPSRYGRHETMPVPTPRIDVQSPSPARRPLAESSLPYPVDDRLPNVFMPPEEYYQYDHSRTASPRQAYSELSRVPQSPNPDSPRVRDAAVRLTTSEDPTRTRRIRSSSVNSTASRDGRRERSVRRPAAVDLDKPLPSCPRSTPSSHYDDWYSLQGYRSFAVCPSCYEGVFADTPFAVHFAQTRLYDRRVERLCNFSSPWTRLAWLLTIKQRRPSLDLLYALADIAETDDPCPGDRVVDMDRMTWYGVPDQRDGVHVANFAICPCDKRMIEALFPTMRGYFTRLPTGYSTTLHEKHLCSLRISSRRFPKYLDLLVELDAEAQSLGQRPNINRFVQLARENAFKGECSKDKPSFRKPWHFILSLPEFTICEECYDELVWPAIISKSSRSPIPRLVNKAIQLVPGEDPEVGSSCCLYSPRMRRVWAESVGNDDFAYLKHRAVERKIAESKLAREREGLRRWMQGLDRGSSQYERVRNELKELEREWAVWE